MRKLRLHDLHRRRDQQVEVVAARAENHESRRAFEGGSGSTTTIISRMEALLGEGLVSKQLDGAYALTDEGREAIERIRRSWIGVIRGTGADQQPGTTTEAPAPAPIIFELVNQGKIEGTIGSPPERILVDHFKTQSWTFLWPMAGSIYGEVYLNQLVRPEPQNCT